MIDPAQVNALRAWVVAALDEALLAGEITESIPLERVVRSEQDAVSLAYPYATIMTIGASKVGTAAEQIPRGDHGSATVTTRTPITVVCSIKITNKLDDAAPDPLANAQEFATSLIARLFSGAADVLASENLAVRDVNPQPALNFLERGSQWVSRAGLDLTLGAARLVVDAPGTIETVEVTGTTTPPTPGDSPQIIG